MLLYCGLSAPPVHWRTSWSPGLNKRFLLRLSDTPLTECLSTSLGSGVDSEQRRAYPIHQCQERRMTNGQEVQPEKQQYLQNIFQKH